MKILISNSAANYSGLKSGLVDICKTYYQHIPLKEIFALAQHSGLAPVDEDGFPWEGFLTGADGRCSIELSELRSGKPLGKFLHLQWHKMPSGKYEINAYTD